MVWPCAASRSTSTTSSTARLPPRPGRRGMSKAALIRESLAREAERIRPTSDPWAAMTGWLDDEPAADIDEVLYGPSRSAAR